MDAYRQAPRNIAKEKNVLDVRVLGKIFRRESIENIDRNFAVSAEKADRVSMRPIGDYLFISQIHITHISRP